MTTQNWLLRGTDGRGPAGAQKKLFSAATNSFDKSRGRLIDQVRSACDRIAGAGWRDLMSQHGLDIEAMDLAHELSKPLVVNRSLPGFEDFAWEGTRGIEPGRPAL